MRKKATFIALTVSTLLALTACSTNEEAPTEAGTATMIGSTVPEVEGMPGENRTVGIVLNNLAKLSRVESALSQHDMKVYSVQFYAGGVSGSIGHMEAEPVAATFDSLRNLMLNDVQSASNYESQVISAEFGDVTREEFLASEELQVQADGLLERIQQREVMLAAAEDEEAVVYAVTLVGEVSKIKEIGRELDAEGFVNLEPGVRVVLPKPATVDAKQEVILTSQSSAIDPQALYEQTVEAIKNEFNLTMGR